LTGASRVSQQPLLAALMNLCEGKIVDTIVAICGWIGSLTSVVDDVNDVILFHVFCFRFAMGEAYLECSS
jgi:hypothetical protein